MIRFCAIHWLVTLAVFIFSCALWPYGHMIAFVRRCVAQFWLHLFHCNCSKPEHALHTFWLQVLFADSFCICSQAYFGSATSFFEGHSANDFAMPTGRVGLVREFGLLALAGTSPGLASQADGNVHSRSHPWEEALAHLDCRSSEDSHFDPVWEKLKTASVRHRWMGQTFLVPALVGNSNETVSPGKHGVQQSSLPAGLDVEREPVMSAEGLFELCEELLERWYPIVWDSPELFDQVLKRRQPPSDLGGLCYYGLITAIFIYAQFMCERHRDFSTALKMVQASLQMLGARLHLDFIHEASSWPFDSLVLMENRDRLLGLRLGRCRSSSFRSCL
jgi:hypothetical protein